MLSFSNAVVAALSRLISLFFSALFGLWSLLGGVAKEPPAAPDDFTPVLRFAVCSDVHLSDGSVDREDATPEEIAAARERAENNTKHFRSLFTDLYAYADAEEYKNVDALLVVGDFTDAGGEEQYAIFNGVVNEGIRPGTKLLTVMGNHEFIRYRDEDASVGAEVYRRLMDRETDTHEVIGGYHFIGVSYDEDGRHFKTKRAWLREQLLEATKEDPSKPVFVFQHPHPFTTVYGSVNWGDSDIRAVLSGFPQVVDFSGHSHYAASDPRSVWQGAFTAVGTGATCAYMSNLNYVSGDEDAPGESGGFWIVEVDADGCVRLRLMDTVNHALFEGAECFLTNAADPTKRLYTWGNRMALDTAPAFPENAAPELKRGENGEALLCFPDAAGYYEAESYKITVTANGLHNDFNGTVVSDYVRAVHTGMAVPLGDLPSAEYRVTVTAFSPYGKKGETLTATLALPLV